MGGLPWARCCRTFGSRSGTCGAARLSARRHRDPRTRHRRDDGDLQHVQRGPAQAAALPAAGRPLQHPHDADGRARDDRHAVERRAVAIERARVVDRPRRRDAENDLTLLHQDGTPQHVRVYGVTEGFFELFGLPMTLGGFTPRPLRAAGLRRRTRRPGLACRRWSSSPTACGRTSITATRRSSASRSASPKPRRTIAGVAPQRLRHAARRRLLVQPAPRAGRHQSLLRRLHAPEAGRDARARQRRDGVDHDRPRARLLRQSDYNRAYVTRPLVASVVGDLGPILHHRDVGDGAAAPARVRQRRPTCCSRAAPPARERWPCASRSARGAAASCGSCSPSRRCSRRRGRWSASRWRISASGAAGAGGVEAAAPRVGDVRRTRARVRAGDARRQRPAGRVRAGAAARRRRTCAR